MSTYTNYSQKIIEANRFVEKKNSFSIYDELPDPTTVNMDSLYFVETTTGIWPFAKKSGFYKSNGTKWVRIPEDNFKESYETVSKNLKSSNANYTYTNGSLSSIAYANGITKTFYYTNGALNLTTLSGSTPLGINLNKNYFYMDGNLTSVGYS